MQRNYNPESLKSSAEIGGSEQPGEVWEGASDTFLDAGTALTRAGDGVL